MAPSAAQAAPTASAAPGATSEDAQRDYLIETAQNTDPTLQPTFAGARIPTFDELIQLRPTGHGYGEGDTYADAVRDWAYNRCINDRNPNQDWCSAAADQGWLDPTNPALGQAIILLALPGGLPTRLAGKGLAALLGKLISRGAAKTTPELASGLERTGTALSKSDPFHRSASWVVDNPAAQRFFIKGGDGVSRELYQLPGEVNGKSGVFEWIIDRSGTNPVINHQRFIPGGSVTGYPNQVVP